MKNKLFKAVILGLVVITVVVAVMSSWVIWHQPETPICIA